MISSNLLRILRVASHFIHCKSILFPDTWGWDGGERVGKERRKMERGEGMGGGERRNKELKGGGKGKRRRGMGRGM